MADVSSVNAIIKNGEVVNSKSKETQELEKTKQATPTGYDKDSFLQILVAQMKYQDPLEPTSNTEYISQYATFTQVEQLNNMANSMALSRASEMVGKTVTITQTNAENGTTSQVQGVVDFVTYSGNKAYLNINGTNYSIDDVTEVLDTNYTSALEVVNDFQKAIDKLPNLEAISDEEHGSQIDTMYTYYMTLMDDKAKNLMDKDYVTSLLQYVNRIDAIRGDEFRTLKSDDEL
ncbi:flagellar hook capping FlgD N-terminal domain-containing protein [Butyrivibrio proteoclasticus]|uniref:flagellar hook capping FlgD N-terminal domain-containing protein n=1 Tax=Butyrivibrio proteoclasticus TaxID=43305 RepID=UPI000685F119|nr:flagellar hook capping FlgD N-terminal domain-containing protein [Butyrivibrio proteoclasticus]